MLLESFAMMVLAARAANSLRIGVLTAFVALSALAVTLGSGSCRAQEDAGTEAHGPYAVHGVVENNVTHQPVPRALVESPQGAVLTDSEGRFTINLPGGYAQLRARRPGYADLRNGWQMLEAGPDMPDLTLYMTPLATVTGHVTLPSGEPAEGIRVTLFRKHAVDGHSRWTNEGAAQTDSGGVFRFLQVQAPGAYVMCTMPAREHEGMRASSIPVYGYPSVCFPGNSDFAGAAPLAVAAGQHAELEETLQKQRFYPVSITIPNRPQGRGVSWEVRSLGGQQAGFTARWNEQKGALETELPNGGYVAEVHAAARNSAQVGRVEFHVADGPVTGLTVGLGPEYTIPVSIRKEFTAARAQQDQATLESLDNSPDVYVNLVPADGAIDRGGGSLQHPAGSTDNGAYQLLVPGPGRYWIHASGYQGYVSSITSGGVDLAREPLTVSPDNAASPIEITLRNDYGEIDCTFNTPEEETAAAGNNRAGLMRRVFFYAIPLFPTTARIAQAVTQLGSQPLQFSNLAPGTYSVVASDSVQEIDLDDVQGLAQLTAKGRTVTVQPNGKVRVQVDVIETQEEAAGQ
jgi:hypothetical protein